MSNFEDMVVLTYLPVFGETRAVKLPKENAEITLGADGAKKLRALNRALCESKSKKKKHLFFMDQKFHVLSRGKWQH